MFEWLELQNYVSYVDAYEMMQVRLSAILNKSDTEAVFVLEHEEVYTAGISAHKTELLSQAGIPIHYTNRGGKFTYHGPGQLVIYPILDLSAKHRSKDIKQYVNNLSLVVIRSLKQFNITAFTLPEQVGVWTSTKFGNKKIASIGIKVHKWITYHGVAINICPNIDRFKSIMPCGLHYTAITSAQELGKKIDMCYYKNIVKQEFYTIFQ